MKILGLILISYLMGILTQRIISYYNNKIDSKKSLEGLKDLQKRLEENIRQVETITFDGVITLITGEKIESEFIRDKIVSVKYIEDRRI